MDAWTKATATAIVVIIVNILARIVSVVVVVVVVVVVAPTAKLVGLTECSGRRKQPTRDKGINYQGIGTSYPLALAARLLSVPRPSVGENSSAKEIA